MADHLHDDDLSVRLRALRSDVDRVAFDPSTAIRRRGNRRSITQVGGTVVAAAAVVLGASVILPDNIGTDGGPATTPTGTSTLGTVDVTTEALLDADELPTSRPSNGPWALLADGNDPSAVLAGLCGESPGFDDADPALVRVFTTAGDTELGAYTRATESLFVDSDATAAANRVSSLFATFGSCPAPDGGPDQRTWELQGAADGGFLVEVPHLETAARPGGYTFVAIARSGPVTTVATLDIVALDETDPAGPLTLAHDALAKLCAEVEVPCPDASVTATQLDSPPSVEPRGDLLVVEDLPTFDDQLLWLKATDVDPSGNPYGHVCTPLWRDLGATSERMRVFSPAGGGKPTYVDHSAAEVAAIFPSADAARDAMAALEESMKNCAENPQAAQGTLVEPLDPPPSIGDESAAWQFSFPSEPGARTIIYTGILRMGVRTALVTLQYVGNGDLDPRPFDDLLDVAGARLASK
jgi:hypothetical protein